MMRITAEDLDNGDRMTFEIEPGNYCIVAAEPCYLAGEQHHANGTTVLTLKGRAAHLMASTDVTASAEQGDGGQT